MPFNIANSLDRVVSYLQASGYVGGARVGEPKEPPDALSKPWAAVYVNSVAVTAIYANGGTRESHVVTVRLYMDMLAEPTEIVEKEMARSVQEILSDILGDADLTNEVMSIDAGGGYGPALRTDWGYVQVGNKMFRIADITLPLVVNDSAVVVAA